MCSRLKQMPQVSFQITTKKQMPDDSSLIHSYSLSLSLYSHICQTNIYSLILFALYVRFIFSILILLKLNSILNCLIYKVESHDYNHHIHVSFINI